MKTISTQEIKRRGISAVDDDLKDGPVHVIKNNKMTYVIMDEKQYAEFISEQESSYDARLTRALDEINKGELETHDSVDALMNEIDSESE